MRGCHFILSTGGVSVLGALLVACAPGPTELSGGVDPTEADPTLVTGPPEVPENGVQLKIVGDPLAPGEEVELCRWMKAGNEEAAAITRIELSAPQGLHHSLVSKAAEAHDPGTEPCFGFPEEVMRGFSIPVPIFASSTQVSEEVLALPEGVGIDIDPRQQLIVNYHFLNATGEEIVPELYLNLHFAEPELATQKAGFYGFGNIDDIEIPPHGTQRITMSCPFPAGGDLITATPHMHQKGVGFKAFLHDGTGPTDVLVEAGDWFAPETTRFDPLVPLSPGDDVTFTCEWENPTDRTVRFGETSDHEMCFLFGFFTPAQSDLIGIEGFGCTVEENVVTP